MSTVLVEMSHIWAVVDIEGECLAHFSLRTLAADWLEAHVRHDIAKGYYGPVERDVPFEWRTGQLGFRRTSFGQGPAWYRVSEEIVKCPLNPSLPQQD